MPRKTATPDEVAAKLTAFLKRSHNAKSVRVDDVRLLTGGASRQTWSFDATIEHADGREETLALIARADQRQTVGLMTRDAEYRLLEAAHAEGVPVPRVHLMGDDSLGAPFFLMERIDGETIARRILRDDEYEGARQKMTEQLGEILAAVHSVPIDRHGLASDLVGPLAGKSPAESELQRIEGTFRSIAASNDQV